MHVFSDNDINILRRSASVTITSLCLNDVEIGKRSCSDKLDDKFELVTLDDNSPLCWIVVVEDSIEANNLNK